MNGKMVLITTEYRGVFAGELVEDKAPDYVVLRNARNCIYWSRNVGGFLGLAVTGPTKECRIGPCVEEFRAYKITSVVPCSDAAAQAWAEAETWK